MKRFLTALILLHCAVIARAQPSVPVSVVLNGNCGNGTSPLFIVINGDENRIVRLQHTDGIWSGVWERGVSDDRAVRVFGSLRLGGARTGVRPATYYSSFIEFTFDCDEQPARTVKVDLNTSVDFSYVRTLRRECVPEFGYATGARTIQDVLFRAEVLLLQFDQRRPNPVAPGLLVDQPRVIRHAEKGGRASLTTSDIARALQDQRLHAFATPPCLGGPAYDLEEKKLRGLGIRTVTISVQ